MFMNSIQNSSSSFFVVQANYSVNNLIRETIEDGWKANAAVYLIIGIVQGLVGACWLLKDNYQLARDCRQRINQFLGRSDELTNVRGNNDGFTELCNKLCKCCPTIAIPIHSQIFEEILLYSSLIVTLVEFIHLEDYKLESAWNYIDCIICRVMEHMLTSEIMKHLETHDILVPYFHVSLVLGQSILANRSCLLLLMTLPKH